VDRPRVDVGVVTYGTRDLTVKALRRLLDEDHGCDIRVLVHDNASPDDTAAAVRAEVPEAEIVASTANVGFGAGHNRILARSDAPWFLCLNSDAWPEPGAIRTLVQTATDNPRTACVAPRLERPDGALDFSVAPFPSLAVAMRCAIGYQHIGRHRAEELTLPGAWQYDDARRIDWSIAACWLLRRDAIDDIGGFDERFFMYAEDLEWCWRAHDRGWDVRFEPAAVVRHVGGASTAAVYNGRQERVWMANTHRLLASRRGRAYTAAYRLINGLGSARLWALARSHRDHTAAARWKAAASAHLASYKGEDAPPTR
jgi:N-acetylglucosaminyl-diphospho-decaprenol L-rhamnosyltransferase